jgi:D-3-phosphoglycerate dehydrogenase / 2-oxoglutarate reductase
MARILVTEPIAPTGLERLRRAGHEVDVRLDLDADGLRRAVVGVDALIIRSATQVTADVLAAGTSLSVVGRAGIGLDNVDVAAATERGIMVCNAPQSNVVSAAEHTVALLLASARNIPQADAALRAGRWERSRWNGVEVYEKTLGIVGLGRVGRLVAQRMLSFGMRLIAYDPYVSAERARQMSVELVGLDDLFSQSDFVTVHLPKTPETVGLVGKDLLARAKPSMRLVNTARGGIVDEEALAQAVRDGAIAGAALDVFAAEPTTESPLFTVPATVVTPHLGASTTEAQDKAGVTVAEQVLLALEGAFVPFAVNVAATEAAETLRPFLPLAERLGAFHAGLSRGAPEVLEVCIEGELADYDTRIVTLSVLKGLFGRISAEPVTYVNAPTLADRHGVEVREINSSTAHEYVNLVRVRGGGHSVAGTLVGRSLEPRIVMIDDHEVELPPAANLVVVRNDDRPGMIGVVGTALGDAGVNISFMALGRDATGERALMALATDGPLPEDLVARLRQADGILAVHVVDLG